VPDTPTTEGSIVAYLRLDDSDWKAKLDEAEARARELGRVDPTIKVHADTAEALAKLEEVKALEAGAGGTVTTTTVSRTESAGSSVASDAAAKVDAVTAATKRLQAAEQAADTAYARAEIASMRLEQIESKRGRTELQVAQAVLANTEAQNRLNTANEKAIAAEDALAAAQRKAAQAAVEQAAAEAASADGTNAQADAANKAAGANRGNAGYMGMVAAVVATLIPLAGPLAGAFSAVAGSVMGMGSAGVLAVLGIKNAMSDGTAAGNDYSAGLHVLKGDLDQLSQTSAVAMLDHFDTAISTINGAMPSLNSEIGMFSGMLGTAGDIVLNALVSGFQTLNPLFAQAGVYIEQVAAGFDKWTTNGGLAKFAHDATVELPQVTNALGSLLKGAVDVIGALAPFGGAMLGVVAVAGHLLSVLATLGPAFTLIGYAVQGVAFVADALVSVLSLLGPVLPGLATGAAAVGLAFLAWNYAIQPLLVKLGVLAPTAAAAAAAQAAVAATAAAAATAEDGAAAATTAWGAAMDFASGPVGIVIGLVAAVAGAMFAATSNTNSATTALQDYTAAVQQDNGVIGQHTQTQAANNLQKSGALALAKQLGIATTTLTAATTTDDAARKKLVSTLQAEVDNGYRWVGAGKAMARTQTEQGKAAQDLLGILNQQHGSIADTIKAYNDVAGSLGNTTYTTKAQKAALAALAAQYGMSIPQFLAAQTAQQGTAAQAATTTQQLQLENDAATLLTNAFALLNGGTLGVAQAQTGAAAAANTLLDSLKTNTTVIEGNTKGAVANQQALESKVAADQQAAEAISKQTGSTEAGTAAFAASKQALIDQLKAAGNLTPAIQALIDKYYAVPPVAKTTADFQADAATLALQGFASAINSINGQTVTVYAQAKILSSPTAVANSMLAANQFATGNAYNHSSGGPIYREDGGAAYLAGGGNPFQAYARGTDTVPAMLTPGEFVVKQKSAAHDPQFLSAYNADPARALASVGGKGGDRPIYMDGTLFGVLREMANGEAQIVVNQAAAQRKATLSTGMQRAAF
jgi:hypothetical protein